uniref:GPI ethanolamine phosphate transferase 2 C-terminal domain-containing protein n=1 Tax=Wuchereria bancrofti TaxID=6293 RepID=A0AAF5PX74_WUCBA
MLCLRDVWILVLCLLQIAAISLFISGFFPKQIHSLDSENNEQDVNNFLDECPHDSILRKALKKQTVAKIVIILIDAWQEQFFYRREAMQFLRQLTSDGQAVAFIAHVQTPTVTMPRIKAVTAGVIPSFADVVMNFASTSITSDNIIDRLNDKGYRCTFCGDETWLRLFPNRFDNHSAEVTSFYVNDFKEVDDNVTFCMRSRLENGAADTWDVMILHYLGLDHIGHSLGGTHSELNNKLIEMDSIIKEIYEKLHKIYGTNFSIIVFGDHGMTEGGSHGGSSELETHVPIVYVDGRKRRTSNETFYVTSVEQVDIVPTLATLFNVPIPKESLGVTLLPYITTDRSNLSVLLFVLQNAEQFRKLYRTSNVLNHCISNSYDSLQKHCAMNASVNVDGLIGECLEELHKIQSQLIHRKTNFDVIQIVIAIGLSFTVSYISAYLVCSTYLYDIYAFQNGDLSTNLAFFAQLLHFAAPFASSLIEEEHDLQYFFFASCLFVMLLEELHIWLLSHNNRRIRSYNSAKSQKIITILFLLIIHRLCRGYTESNRRRWILERNISQSNRIGLLNYYEIFTSIGGSSDMPDIASLLKQFNNLRFISCSLSLILIGILLILHYGKRTSHPKLIRFLILVTLFGTFLVHHYKSRVVFLMVFILNVFLLLLLRDLFLSLIVWAVLIMRTYNLPLAVLQLFLGYCLARIDATPFLIIRAIFSSFFYLGNSNNFSTVDIAVGFVGVETYQPIQIAVQILLSTYSGPLLTAFGWWQYLVEESVTSISLSHKRNSLLCWISSVLQLNMSLCLLSLYIQRYHLFVWSVFAPKFVYEFSHLVLLTVVNILIYIYDKFDL